MRRDFKETFMTRLRITHGMILLSLMAFAPALARAQEPANTLQDLQPQLRINDTVRVEETDGKRVQGKVESVSGSALTIRVKGQSREFRQPQISSVQKQYDDPIGNGVITGAAVGGVAGAVIGVIVSDVFCDGCGNFKGGGALIVGALGAGIGAGSGALGDLLTKGYKTVFSKSRASDLRLDVSPIVSRTSKGVSVAIRF
jgi:hypothetical protein